MSVDEFWQEYLDSLAEDAPHPDDYQAWGFGDTPEMADELGRLVVEGIKTGTASLAWEYAHDGEEFPRVGDCSVVLDGAGEPLCIIETTRVYVEAFKDVDAEQAHAEGEGDRSLEYWREAHWDYFSRRCEVIGRAADECMPVMCERFRVVWQGKEQ